MTDEKNLKMWTAPDPRAVFLLAHGLGTHAGRWRAMAEYFGDNGLSSYAIDLPKLDTICAYYREILRIRDMIIKENPGKKIFLVGESLGALAAFLFTAEEPGSFDGLVCISPAFANKKKFTLLKTLQVVAALILAPSKKIDLPFDSAMCTRDAAYRDKMDADPLEYRSASVRLIVDILKAQIRARSLVKKMDAPVLFLIAGADKIVDPQASRDIFKELSSKDKTIMDFHGMQHSLSIELGKEAVFDAILKWVDKRLTA